MSDIREEGEARPTRARPAADDYVGRHEARDGGRRGGDMWLPVAAFLVLGMITAGAYLMQGTPIASNEAEQKPPPPAGPLNASYEETLASLESAVAADPTDTLALGALAELLLQAHQPERSLALIDAWIELAPMSGDAHQRRVMALGSLERWDDALAANEVLYELDPTSVVTRVNMGALFANLGRTDEARAWWTAVIEEAPGTTHAQAAQRALDQLASR